MRRRLFLFAVVLMTIPIGCGRDRVQTPVAPKQIRVLSYNIKHGRGMDGKIDLPRIAKVIRAIDPDIVALQEVDQNTNRCGKVDQPAELAKLTGMKHVRFGKAMDYDGGGYGEAVLCKHPLTRTINHPLPHAANHEPRAALAVWVDFHGRTIVFIGTHLDHTRDPANRMAQAEEIDRLYGKAQNPPHILAGDLNAPPDSEVMKTLLTNWTASHGDTPKPTAPSVNPRSKIDYILYRPADSLRVLEMKVIEETVASDHRPVLTVFEMVD